MSGLEVLSDPERWSVYVPRFDSFGVLDPITLRPLGSATIPTWIENEPDLHKGLEYLRMYGHRTHVLVGYGAHDTAEDLGALNDSKFENQVTHAHYYGFENNGHNQEEVVNEQRATAERVRRSWQYGNNLEAYLRQQREEDKAYSSFFARVNHARFRASYGGAVSFSYDVARDGTAVEQAVCRAHDIVIQLPTTELSALMLAGVQLVRECIALAKTGLYVSRGEEQRRTPRSVEVFETMGASHAFYSDRLRMLGVRAKSWFIERERWQDAPMPHILPQIASKGAVLAEELPALCELHTRLSRR